MKIYNKGETQISKEETALFEEAALSCLLGNNYITFELKKRLQMKKMQKVFNLLVLVKFLEQKLVFLVNMVKKKTIKL